MKTVIKSILFLVLLVCLIGCNQFELVHDLNERDANEIIVLLAKHGIKAQKKKEERQQEIFWTITVDQDDEREAQSILVANHLPRIRQGGLKEVCGKASMIVTEKFEKCRQMLALKGEIINALESVPGVVSADVVLNIPDKEEFPEDDAILSRPTAAVTVRYLADAPARTDLSEGKIQEFVSNTVNGLDPRDVKVILSYIEQNGDRRSLTATETDGVPTGTTDIGRTGETTSSAPQNLVSVGGIQMDAASAKKFKIIAAVFLLLLLLLAAAFIFALLRMARMRKRVALSAAQAAEDAGGEEEGEKKLLEA